MHIPIFTNWKRLITLSNKFINNNSPNIKSESTLTFMTNIKQDFQLNWQKWSVSPVSPVSAGIWAVKAGNSCTFYSVTPLETQFCSQNWERRDISWVHRSCPWWKQARHQLCWPIWWAIPHRSPSQNWSPIRAWGCAGSSSWGPAAGEWSTGDAFQSCNPPSPNLSR